MDSIRVKSAVGVEVPGYFKIIVNRRGAVQEIEADSQPLTLVKINYHSSDSI